MRHKHEARMTINEIVASGSEERLTDAELALALGGHSNMTQLEAATTIATYAAYGAAIGGTIGAGVGGFVGKSPPAMAAGADVGSKVGGIAGTVYGEGVVIAHDYGGEIGEAVDGAIDYVGDLAVSAYDAVADFFGGGGESAY